MLIQLCYCMFMYLGKHDWCLYVLTPIFKQTQMHECVYKYMLADMHKTLLVIMCVCIICICMHVHMYGAKNPYVCMYVCMEANMHESIYVYIYIISMYVGRHA